MKHFKYAIRMQVPLGIRNGSLILNGKSGKVTGVLSILGHDERIDGFIDTDGTCSFDGSIVTITRSMAFHATGKLEGSKLELEIINEDKHYFLTGTEEENEEIL